VAVGAHSIITARSIGTAIDRAGVIRTAASSFAGPRERIPQIGCDPWTARNFR
jgi:hypothetical protein